MRPRLKNTLRLCRAFTLVELLVALVVTSIILSAVSTLAYAMSSASRTSDDTIVKEAQSRQARLWIGELIRNCRMICASPGSDVVIWRADDNDDGLINVGEIVYIERGSGLNMLRLCQFSPTEATAYSLASLRAATMKAFLVSKYAETYVSLIPSCTNVQFSYDAAPPFTRRLTTSFSLIENGAAHPYEMTMAMRARVDSLLKPDGTALDGDGDDD